MVDFSSRIIVLEPVFSWRSDCCAWNPLLIGSYIAARSHSTRKWTSLTQKFEPTLHRPSPTTCSENGTNPSADLVGAISSVICEVITWRPFFFWFTVPGICGTAFLVASRHSKFVKKHLCLHFFNRKSYAIGFMILAIGQIFALFCRTQQ